jgi:Anti-sigma factor NepR
MATPEDPFHFVRAGIGSGLRGFFADVLTVAIPDEMVELLRQLDRPPQSGHESGHA